MLNLFEMNIYRVIRSKSTWILMGVSIVFLILTLLMLNMGNEKQLSLFSGAEQVLQNGNLLILVIVFCVILTNGKYKDGYIKNIDAIVSKRYKYYISEILVSMIFIIMMFLVVVVGSVIGTTLISDGISFSDVFSFIFFFLTQVIIYTSFASLVICVFVIVRNAAVCTTVLMAYIFVFDVLVGMLIDLIINKVFGEKAIFRASDLSIVEKVYTTAINSSVKSLFYTWIVAFAVLGITGFISIIILNRRDVK